MTELTFAKQYLTTLEKKPIKLQSHYVADARQLPAQSAYILPRNPKPIVKQTYPPTQIPSSSTTAASTESSHAYPSQRATVPSSDTLKISFKPLRPTSTTPSPTLSIPSSEIKNTSVYDLKRLLSPKTGYAPDKIKILWDKKPIGDTKLVIDVLRGTGEEGKAEVSMGIMYVGQPTVKIEKEDRGAAGGVESVVEEPGGSTAEVGVGDKDVEMKGAESVPVAQGKTGRKVLETSEFWDDLLSFVLQRTRDEEIAAPLVRGWRENFAKER